MLCVRCQAGKNNRKSGSKRNQLAVFSWQLANCRGRPVCLPELAVVFDTDTDGDGEPRKQQSGVGFSSSHELFRLGLKKGLTDQLFSVYFVQRYGAEHLFCEA